MKKKILLLLTILVVASMATACGNEESVNTQVPEETEVEVEVEVEESEPEETEAEKDLPDGNYTEMGEGTAYLSTAGGTSEGGNVPVVYASSDTLLLQIGLNTEGFNGGALSFIYVDGMLLTKEQLSDSQCSLTLGEVQLSVGVHKVEIVQYTGDDPTAEMITYKTASYEIK